MLFSLDTDLASLVLSNWIGGFACFGKLDSACTNKVDRSKFYIICDRLEIFCDQMFISETLSFFAKFSWWAFQRRLDLRFSSFSFRATEELSPVQIRLLVRFMVFFCLDVKSISLIGLDNCIFSDKVLKWIHRKCLANLISFHVESAHPTAEHVLTESSARNISEHCRKLENVSYKFHNDWEQLNEMTFTLSTANFTSLFTNNPHLRTIQIDCAGELRGSVLLIVSANCKQLSLFHLTVSRLKMLYFDEILALLNGCEQLTSLILKASPIDEDESIGCYKYERDPVLGGGSLVLSNCHGYNHLTVTKFFDSFGGFTAIILNELKHVSSGLIEAIKKHNIFLKSLILSGCCESESRVKKKVIKSGMFAFVEVIKTEFDTAIKFKPKTNE